MWLHNMSVVLFLLLFCHMAQSASILALFSSLSFADHLVFRGFVSLLTRQGHTVVLMTPYPGYFDYPDVDRIVEISVAQESVKYWDEYKNVLSNTDDYYERMREINELSIKIAVSQLTSKPMTALLANPHVKFDLVITEADVPILYGAAEKYQASHISMTPSNGRITQYESKGSPTHPILYPDVNTLNYRNLTSWQKIVELNRYFQTRYEYYNNYLPLCEIAAKKIFGIKRNIIEIEYDIDLLFVAGNPLLIGNRPTTHAIKYVDRLHIKPGFGLPEDLGAILNSATKGAIYFSLGALQESEHLSLHILETLAAAFRELPYLVLWKIGNTTMFDKPENVIANEWFPQQELLAHPNMRAFITHGGPRSLEEAIFYQVPIIGLPNVKSRSVFIKEITRHGAGEVLNLHYLEKEQIKEVISKVASTDSYKKAMIKLKSMVVDPIISGPENAQFWTEYVLRHGGAKHLRSPAVGLSSFIYYLLDIISVLLCFIFILLISTYLILRYIIKRLKIRFLQRFKSSGKFKAL